MTQRQKKARDLTKEVQKERDKIKPGKDFGKAYQTTWSTHITRLRLKKTSPLQRR